MFNFLTIKVRILLTFALLSSLAIYYFSNWVSDSSRRHYLESAEELLVDQLIIIKSIIEQNTPIGSDKPDLELVKKVFNKVETDTHPQAQIYAISKNSTDVDLYITDRKGTVLFHSKKPSFEGESFFKWRNVLLALANKYGARSTRDDKEDPTTSNLHVTHPIFNKDEIIGTVTLVKPVKRISRYLELSRDRVTRIAIGTLLLILLLGFLLMRRIVNPIEDLTKYTKKVSEGERPSLPNLPKGELQLLGKTIEEMTKNLDGKAYVEAYIQGLTHELKSPIAAIKGASELIEAKNLSEEEVKLFRNINRESDRMSEMVHKLLVLSRIENQAFNGNLELIDLRQAVKEVIDEAEERYPGRAFKFEFSETCQFKADRLLMKTAISNVIANACEFSENLIEVELENKSGISLKIKDGGVGIPDFALEKVFEKFYSLPRPGSGAKSSGLGLAIVLEIIQLHKGEISIDNRRDSESGVVVEFKFPIN